MSKIAALSPQAITPKMLLATLADEIEEIEDIYIVAIPKQGGHRTYVAGGMTNLGQAVLVLQQLGLVTLESRIPVGDDAEKS